MSVTIFNTEIFKADLSDRLDIPQRHRVWDPHSCLRPNTEFDLPVICQVKRPSPGPSGGPRLSQGAEYDLFEKCCPITKTDETYNQWVHINTCELSACFTNNETLATQFDQCIYGTASNRLNTTRTTIGYSYRGRCEWIDFDSLKKGIRDVQEIDNSTPVQKSLPWVLLMATLTVAMLGHTIG